MTIWFNMYNFDSYSPDLPHFYHFQKIMKLNPQSMSKWTLVKTPLKTYFWRKKDKNLPDPGAISQVYIFWTCRIALQTFYLGPMPVLAIAGIKTPGSTADLTDLIPYRSSTILSECWRQHVRNISDNFEKGGIPHVILGDTGVAASALRRSQSSGWRHRRFRHAVITVSDLLRAKLSGMT